MASSNAATVDEYLSELPPDRREAVAAIRQAVLKNLPPGYEEAMQYGMIGYSIPLERYSNTHNRQPLGLVGIASQKNYISVYLNNIYADPEAEEWFTAEYKATGKKLDKGKGCVRFKKLDDVPLDLIGKAIARTSVADLIKSYEASRRKV
jgi:uncharacterized protein YdhG (YjbR/CyaY superfamily)